MQNFIVDISAPSGPLVLYAMQADSMSRFFSITVTDKGAPWEAPTGAAWTVRFGAPRMPAGWYDTIAEPDGGTHPAVVVDENTATIEIAEQAVSIAGQNTLCVLVTDAQGYQIASWPFTLSVQGVPGMEAPEATVYYNALTAQVAETLANAQAAASSAAEAASFAQSINPSQFMTISQYGGSTTGVVAAADALHTPRNIGMANFNGTSNITLQQIGAAPINHISADGTYGKAGATTFGHVMLSSESNSSAGVESGTAATPFAVKAVADASMPKAGGTFTGNVVFSSSSYDDLSFVAQGDQTSGMVFGVQDKTKSFLASLLNTRLNNAGNADIRYNGYTTGKRSLFRIAFGSRVLSPTPGNQATTLFNQSQIDSLFMTSGEQRYNGNTVVYATNGDYGSASLNIVAACGTGSDVTTWFVRTLDNAVLPETIRVNFIVITFAE